MWIALPARTKSGNSRSRARCLALLLAAHEEDDPPRASAQQNQQPIRVLKETLWTAVELFASPSPQRNSTLLLPLHVTQSVQDLAGQRVRHFPIRDHRYA